MDSPDATGHLVQDLIRALTLSRAELAERVGVSTATVQSWAVGRRTPRRENGRRLARVATRHHRRIVRLTTALLESVGDGDDADTRVTAPAPDP